MAAMEEECIVINCWGNFKICDHCQANYEALLYMILQRPVHGAYNFV